MSDEKLVIRGGRRLEGKVALTGAKNAALPVLVGSVLCDEPVTLENVPLGLADVSILVELLAALGVEVEGDSRELRLDASKADRSELPAELGERIRSSIVFLGPLLARHGRASVVRPGGCKIGDRRYDLHLDGLRALGAEIQETEDRILARAKGLRAADIDFYLPTTTGTQNVLMGALGAAGRTTIRNANTRPENQDLGGFLEAAGASVRIGNRIVQVEGRRLPRGCRFRIMSGRDEMITYIMAAAVTGGEIQIENATLKNIPSDLQALRAAGLELFEWGGSVYVSAREPLRAFDIFTAPYPGINSDMQPLFSALAALAEGESTITDMRFTDRFQYVPEFQKLGVDIAAFGNCAIVRGGQTPRSGEVTATDLRTGAALILLGLAAKGETLIDNVYQIDRGYDRIEEKLGALGAEIQRVDSAPGSP
jgi:UDP-N-acetylglucosamine 1-carboxyvinyltransferase